MLSITYCQKGDANVLFNSRYKNVLSHHTQCYQRISTWLNVINVLGAIKFPIFRQSENIVLYWYSFTTYTLEYIYATAGRNY